ncbi:hypothetical protein D9756_006010 [Leucocoprinus leucothites]|uniref:RRM domain-containing protein n=1 Tax=Leucocoprinus leucothites TaxID=201217 RepID=A0A8H5D569_9AGAR|nr:hypothetical protein D9756_006010 [Leucoagaricus leucothites]
MPPKQPSQTRAWGTRYDTLPSSPPVSPEAKRDETQSALEDLSTTPNSQGKCKEDKQPHDASVFVGSLPSNVEQSELTRLLTCHLSEHTEIKSIKVIRDSKGGVCAFVQCEDATSASTFLRSLQTSPPKPFLGRILRYEPARAFRTLLISYRTPPQAILPESISRVSPRSLGGILELDLPNAICIWKPKNNKIVYNAEAIEAERYTRSLAKDDVIPTNEEAIYLQPLKFDAESILKIARYFGPVEKVSRLTGSHELVKAPKNGIIGPECYPPPHNASRSKGMDAGCWEVKWDHRDDCVAALMVLRRVPHLTVSWAHQPQNHHAIQRTHSHSPGYQPVVNHASEVPPKGGRFQPYDSPSLSSPLRSTAFSGEALPEQSLQPNNVPEDNNGTLQNSANGFGSSKVRAWVDPVTPPGLGHKSVSDAPDVRDKSLNPPPLSARIDWADSDFSSFVDSEYDSKIDWSVWGETTFERDMIKATSIIASQSVCEVSTPQRARLPSPLLQEGEVPMPGLVMSPPTPRTTLSQIPATPVGQSFCVPFSTHKSQESVLEPSDSTARIDREFDPTALFVGGLELLGPGAWTEEKVRAFFGRFRGLEYVKFVRPPTGHAAFAFVKYNNTDSPAQAIIEEHNRVYAGRALKVQLRDINPPRSPWRHNKGRGRFAHYGQSRKVMLSSRPLGHIPVQEDSHPGQSLLQNDEDANKVVSPKTSRNEPDELKTEGSLASKQQKEEPIARVLEDNQGEKYREWYDAPGAVSASESASASVGSTGPPLAPALPYPVPPGYYPMPWIPYAQPGHYHMSYYGPYPAYPVPGVPMAPYPATPPGSDTNGPTAGTLPWSNIIYNPYAPYFGAPRPVMDQQNPPPVNSGSPATSASQAPLAPSGFVQNDQGTLIAVYPPDALDQYMSGQSNGSSSVSNPSTSAQSISTSTAWPSTQAISGSASTSRLPPQAGSSPHRIHPGPANPHWNPVPPPFPPMLPGLVTGPATPTYNVNAAVRASDPHDHSGANSPSANFGKRQGGNRRDFHPQNGNRSSRSFNARNGHGHIHNQNLTGNTEGVNSHYRNFQSVNNSDWNQYARR